MKIIKYIFASILLVLSIGEIMPIYLISSGLLLGQTDDGSTAYFIGKLTAHIIMSIIMFYFGLKIIKNVKNTDASEIENT